MDDIGGVWRTIGGRRVFIKDGQSLDDAMKESGKFKDKEDKEKAENEDKNETQKKTENIDTNKIEEKIASTQKEVDELEDKGFGGGTPEDGKKIDELNEKINTLEKQRLDALAEKDKSIIQDKDLRDYVYDYTNGDYKIACDYTERLANGASEDKAFKDTKYYQNTGTGAKSDSDFNKSIALTKELSNEIDKNTISSTLTRFEKTQTDYGRDVSHQYKVGEEVNWGIKSTSSNEDYFNKVMRGEDKINASSLRSAEPYTYTEYRIIGDKNGLDISKYSRYPDQDEVLTKGKFVVEKVEHFKPTIVYDKKEKTFNDYLKDNNYTYNIRTSKSGNQIIEIKDGDKTVLNDKVDNFADKVKTEIYGYGNDKKVTIDDILNGKVPYSIEETENKEKSTYGYARQIVTLRKKK